METLPDIIQKSLCAAETWNYSSRPQKQRNIVPVKTDRAAYTMNSQCHVSPIATMADETKTTSPHDFEEDALLHTVHHKADSSDASRQTLAAKTHQQYDEAPEESTLFSPHSMEVDVCRHASEIPLGEAANSDVDKHFENLDSPPKSFHTTALSDAKQPASDPKSFNAREEAPTVPSTDFEVVVNPHPTPENAGIPPTPSDTGSAAPSQALTTTFSYDADSSAPPSSTEPSPRSNGCNPWEYEGTLTLLARTLPPYTRRQGAKRAHGADDSEITLHKEPARMHLHNDSHLLLDALFFSDNATASASIAAHHRAELDDPTASNQLISQLSAPLEDVSSHIDDASDEEGYLGELCPWRCVMAQGECVFTPPMWKVSLRFEFHAVFIINVRLCAKHHICYVLTSAVELIRSPVFSTHTASSRSARLCEAGGGGREW